MHDSDFRSEVGIKGKNMAFVYILKSERDGSYYVGCTKDFKRRYEDHVSGRVRYTKLRKPLKTVFLKRFDSFSEASIFEKKVKSWKKRKSIERMLNKPDNLVAHCEVV